MDQDNKWEKESLIDWNKKRGLALFEISKAISLSQFNAILEFSKIAIRGAFLLNGAAGIAILYNIRQLPKEFHTSLWMCGAGAILAIACAGFAYLAQYLYAKTDADNINAQLSNLTKFIDSIIIAEPVNISQPPLKKSTCGIFLHTCAVVAWVASISFFSAAAWRACTLIQSLVPAT